MDGLNWSQLPPITWVASAPPLRRRDDVPLPGVPAMTISEDKKSPGNGCQDITEQL